MRYPFPQESLRFSSDDIQKELFHPKLMSAVSYMIAHGDQEGTGNTDVTYDVMTTIAAFLDIVAKGKDVEKDFHYVGEFQDGFLCQQFYKNGKGEVHARSEWEDKGIQATEITAMQRVIPDGKGGWINADQLEGFEDALYDDPDCPTGENWYVC